ncbi:fumarylacetoacetate hydrolase family protein [Nocardioides sp. LHG3406-4]|uniref:fumarylacetoacetate hydrolase family protein n=1 Tax=Nocardioides sp. LHG3406-4 TaxID=2804575 RepID=UPI003CF1BD5A
MKLIGQLRSDGDIDVVDLDDDGSARVVASLDAFWAAPHEHASGPATGPRIGPEELRPVPPVLPAAKVLCIGLNYADHVAEGSFAGTPRADHPTIFGRWTDSLTVDGAAIPVPPDEDGLDWEGEVMAWVGRTLVDATPEEALAAVVGYSPFNDVTARRAQKLTSQWTVGKNADASGPLGAMTPAHEIGDLSRGPRLATRVNGETVQEASTDQMIFGVGETLAEVSRTLTLRPGDLLATGTPSGVGYARTPVRLLQPGDVVEVEVERLGRVRNQVVGAQARHRP